MSNIPQEQPPIKDPFFSEWLTRLVILINGSFNAIRQSEITNFDLITAESFDIQSPVGLDLPLQIQYGDAQISDDRTVEIDANGTVIFHQKGEYELDFVFNVGRGSNNQHAYLLLYSEVNDVELSSDIRISITVDHSDDDLPITYNTHKTFKDGDFVKLYIVRDSKGDNDGGLFPSFQTLPAAPDTPSVWMRIRRRGLTEGK